MDPAQPEVLRILGDHAPLSLSGLGGLLVSESGTNPSKLVDRLVSVGLITRAVDDADLDAATASLDLRPVIDTLRVMSAGGLAGTALQNRLTHAGARSGD